MAILRPDWANDKTILRPCNDAGWSRVKSIKRLGAANTVIVAMEVITALTGSYLLWLVSIKAIVLIVAHLSKILARPTLEQSVVEAGYRITIFDTLFVQLLSKVLQFLPASWLVILIFLTADDNWHSSHWYYWCV